MSLQIIGDPVLHSKSPVIQGAMLAALGLDLEYTPHVVRRGELPQYLAWARERGVTGFNATMPHKEDLIPLLDEADPAAKTVGAVNTVCIRDGKAMGYNTDGGGFLRALGGLGVEPAGKRVMLLGSGGAAKAVAAALVGAGAAVTVCNRTLSKAEQVAAMAPGAIAPADFKLETLRAVAADSGLLVNCTSLGMEGTASQFDDLTFLEALPRGAAVCDAIYAPAETLLLKKARELGHPAMNGMGMLLHQAILALERFTGEKLDVERAKAAALTALAEEG